ncbi:ASPM [Symbiodinium microadriaticum]|nr:ASPM [Symbiodinium microadriaticum]
MELEETGLRIQPSQLGGAGIFATRSFKPGDQVFTEKHVARLGVTAVDRDIEGLKARFDELAGDDAGITLTNLRSTSLFRGPSGSLGEERRNAYGSWASSTWPDASPGQQEAMADAMTIMSYNSYVSLDSAWQLVYPIISKANHSCLSNVTTVASQDGFGELVCLLPIHVGDEILTSYLCDSDLTRPITQRKKILLDRWDFDCCCSRCVALEDDTRRFTCQSLRDPPQWMEPQEASADDAGETVEESTGSSICADILASSEGLQSGRWAKAWLQREEEGEKLLEAVPEALFAAWAKLEEFANAHPCHGLSGRWKRHLAMHTEREAAEAETAEEAEELYELVDQYWADYRRCLEVMLPERHEGGLLDGRPADARRKQREKVERADAGAPPVDTMIVTIPEGSQPGDELSFTAPSGQEVIVAVPEGALPGEELEIPLPPQAMTKESVASGVGAREAEADRQWAQLTNIGGYPALSAEPPIATSYELTKSSGLPALPSSAAGAPDPEPDDVAAARHEVEAELRARQTTMDAVGRGAESGVSTPDTQLAIKKDRDFVRRNLPMNLQQQYLRRVSTLPDIVNRSIKVPVSHKQLYTEAMWWLRRVVGMALEESARTGSKWSQMFRPGFNDLVNETFKVGANACIFSKTFLSNKQEREQFLRMHVKDSNGILWFELQRELESIYYQRIDFVDVQMYHPFAWGFPDSSKIVTPNPGEPIDPFHGWCARKSMDSVTEMEDVDFLYTLRLRCFPESTFQALSLGKIPAFIQQYIDIHKDTLSDVEDEEEEGPDKAAEEAGSKSVLSKDEMLDYGLREDQETLALPEDINRQQKGNSGPDVLDAQIKQFKLKGLSAMRVFLRTRGVPDNMKQCQITPKMVKDMAAQLGVRPHPDLYWYCMFALRYSLAPEWEVIVKQDTRFYVHLPTDRMQIVHPMIRRFREHLEDTRQNEFLWEYRGFVQMKCSECGIPDAIVWCQQCTDYFCATCFLSTHKTARGKKHWPSPIPGCRYLTASEAARMHDHLPLLNVGFSMRRRFLARDNQSDRNGSRSGDTWLFFHADTFEAALLQAPEKHWFLKRLKPPRLAPTAEGYYYNFRNDVIADDPSHIMSKAHEQKAIALLQKNIRGVITRKRIKQELKAAKIIQKSKRMWDVRKAKTDTARNLQLLKGWYMRYQANERQSKMLHRVTRFQAVWRGYMVRCDHYRTMRDITRFQAKWKGTLTRRRHQVLVKAGLTIQRYYRGRLYGRRPMREMNEAASKLQAMARGVALRDAGRDKNRAAAYVQAHWRGYEARKMTARRLNSVIMLQRNWRRFQSQLDVKVILYDRMETVRQRFLELIRSKLEGSAAVLIQRNWRRHSEYHKVVTMRKTKAEADKRISTLLTAFYTAASEIRHYIHPWWRHLPTEIQEVLSQVKASMQRTIGLVHVTGKLANEEIGKRGLRVSGHEHLYYNSDKPDLASHMLLSVTRHLLNQIPAETFPQTVEWACYAMGHQAVKFALSRSFIAREIIPVGKEIPAHPGDSLATLWETSGTVKHHHDWLITLSEESLPCLVLNTLPASHRHVYLTAEVLVTMRQALESPTISTEDHLRFQGLDATAGAQMMEVLSSELDHRLPHDWTQQHGTVAALAIVLSNHMKDFSGEKDKDGKPLSTKAKAKSKSKADAKAKGAAKRNQGRMSTGLDIPRDGDSVSVATTTPGASPTAPFSTPLPEGGALSHFTRAATMRVLQQVGYFMRGQDEAMQSVLAKGSSDPASPKAGAGMRANRFVSVTDKLFEMADRAMHDHCSFVLAVVLLHMVLRGLHLRLLYHRAAVSIQQRYRYIKLRGQKQNAIAPAMRIQRHWRGLRAALGIMRKDDAAWKILRNYKAWKWNLRASKLLNSVLRIQRAWHSSVHRKWIKRCHKAAACIQRHARGFAVRLMLDPVGRQLTGQCQDEIEALVAARSQMSETRWWAKTAVRTAKARVEMARHRQRSLDRILMQGLGPRSDQARLMDKQRRLRYKGALQPARESVFEPFIFALARLDAVEPRYGAKRSPVMQEVDKARKHLIRWLPAPPPPLPHIAARRGRRAVLARRLAKKARHAQPVPEVDMEEEEDESGQLIVRQDP